VDAGFDPRRRARSRRYEYRVWNASVRSPLLRGRAWHVRYPLDDESLREAATLLVGEHDFAAFAGPLDPPGASTVRRVFAVAVERDGRLLRLEFGANAFLPHQVRRTVGALVQVGRGRLTVEQFAALLREALPGVAGPAAPPQGLCLMEVTYDGVRFDTGET
jgi:tRNA pseudouridine38-40 synthase